MKILLVNVPPWYPSQPYLSIPALTAVLKQFERQVKQIDLNLEFYSFLLKKETLKNISEIQTSYLNLTKKNEELHKNIHVIIDEIEASVKTFKTEAIFDIEQYSYAKKVIELALITYSIYDPKCEVYLDNVIYNFNHYNIPEILNYVESQQNIFRYYFDFYFNYNKMEFDVIGISVTTSEQLIPALTLSSVIRKNNNAVKIIYGGDIITRILDVLQGNSTLHSYFDFCIYGFGEDALPQLINEIKTNQNYSKVPNCMYFQNTEIKKTLKERLKNINNYPPPDFTDLKLTEYFTPRLILPYEISKGCYWGKCTFCEIAGLPYYTKSAEKVVSDLVAISNRYNVYVFTIVDSAAPPKILNNISQHLSRLMERIYWSALIRAEEYFTEEIIRNLWYGGCRMVFIGFESGSSKIIDLMEKGIKIETMQSVLDRFYAVGIWIHGYFMTSFPKESIEDAHLTLGFIKNNVSKLSSIGFSIFSLAKGTPVFNELKKHEITFENVKENSLSTHVANLETEMLSSEELNIIEKYFIEVVVVNKKFTANNYYHLNELLLISIKSDL